MTTLVKPNSVTVGQLWRSYSHIRLCNRRDTELLDMTRSHAYTSHSYTSLRDVVDSSFPAATNKQWSSHLSSFQSLPDIRHVHMKNPLVEKAARAYLATASYTQYQHHSNLSSSFSSFMKIVRFPFQTTQKGFHSFFGGASAWLRQMYIKC